MFNRISSYRIKAVQLEEVNAIVGKNRICLA